MYIENLVTPNEDESTLNSMKKLWSYIKSKKLTTIVNITKTGGKINNVHQTESLCT